MRTKSHSDCEVILPLFEKIGVSKMMPKLGSEFAFIIFDVSADSSRIKITVGRDPIGVRPLFYATKTDDTSIESVCFSSELKGLCDIFQEDTIDVFPPGYYAEFEVDTKKGTSR
ncbi:MAG: hypothetical protein JSR17_01035 [Proteobacteria bacterium]|nr:hypothetical protein [Pseudomonadota bacterium]